MRESPILFSAPMVRAILDGRKTVTRRIIKPQPPAEAPFYRGSIGTYSGANRPRHFWGRFPDREAFLEAYDREEVETVEDILWPGGDSDGFTCDVYAAESGLACPYGAAKNDLLREGDRLWVRETFMRVPHPSEVGLTRADMPHTWEAACAAAGSHLYRADDCSDIFADGRRWTPSIHMPRAASRITLEVTAVRVERLQDISQADAIAEGIEQSARTGGWLPGNCAEPEWAFRELWEQINGAGSWDANPWVWAVEFRRIEQGALAHG